MLFLLLLFRQNSAITPEEALRDYIVNRCMKFYQPDSVQTLLVCLSEELQKYLNGRALVIAADEAHRCDYLTRPTSFPKSNSY
jgi:hypothetical protein